MEHLRSCRPANGVFWRCFPISDGVQILSKCLSTVEHLRIILNDSEHILKMELAAMIDAGKVFVKKTYVLEGDGLLSTDTYCHLQEVATTAAAAYYPNVESVARDVSPADDDYRQQLVSHARQCIRPAITYFLRRFCHQDGDIYPLVRVCKAAQLCSPHYVDQARPAHMEVDALKAFPALDSDETIRLLKEELPAYIVAAEDIAADTATAAWWLRQQNLPSWKKAAKMVLTVQPSSAAAERVFSLLEAATGDQQSQLLEDNLLLAIMLQYNRGRQVVV